MLSTTQFHPATPHQVKYVSPPSLALTTLPHGHSLWPGPSTGGGTATTYDSKRDSSGDSGDRQHGSNDGGAGRGRGGARARRASSEDIRELNSLRMPGATDEGQAPDSILCQLSKRVVRDPVRTPYGHVRRRQPPPPPPHSTKVTVCPLAVIVPDAPRFVG